MARAMIERSVEDVCMVTGDYFDIEGLNVAGYVVLRRSQMGMVSSR